MNMRHDLLVSQSIIISASAEQVWKGMTDPKIITKYLYGTETITDWRVGSEIVFQGEYEGMTYRDHGVILENEPLQKIRYSYWSGFSGMDDNPENYSEVMYELKVISGNSTVLTWTQKGYADESRYEHSKSGMVAFLESIRDVIETNSK